MQTYNFGRQKSTPQGRAILGFCVCNTELIIAYRYSVFIL